MSIAYQTKSKQNVTREPNPTKPVHDASRDATFNERARLIRIRRLVAARLCCLWHLWSGRKVVAASATELPGICDTPGTARTSC
jgi:hypothetical protein